MLGNALEGVQVEEEEGDKAEDESLVENNDNVDGMCSCMCFSSYNVYFLYTLMGIGHLSFKKMPLLAPASLYI